MLSSNDLLEGTDGVLQRNELALVTGEDLGDLERLRHEALNLTGTFDLQNSSVDAQNMLVERSHRELVLFG